MTNTLDVTIATTHQVLAERLRHASAGVSAGATPRDVQQYADTFLASTCRHMCAANTVLVPAARQWLPDGAERRRGFHRQSRRLDLALRQVKSKVYGDAYAVQRSWADVWDDARTEFEATARLERQIVDALVAAIGVRASDALANRLYLAEVKAPTRPHPYAPRGGTSALLARLIWARADRFWDGLEGRAIPTSTGVRTRPRRGLMTQYVMGNPADEPTAEAS